MSEYLYSGVWQLCVQEDKDCFGMVAATVLLSGDQSIRLYFNVGKVHFEHDEDEIAIDLPEIWAQVFAETLSAVLISSDYLFRLYRQGRLASCAIYSDEADIAALSSEPTFDNPIDLRSMNSAANPIAREIKADIQTETRMLYHRQALTKVGSVSAFGSIEDYGTIRIRLSKAAIHRISADQNGLDIVVPQFLGEDLSLRVREARFELRQLRMLKRRGLLSTLM